MTLTDTPIGAVLQILEVSSPDESIISTRLRQLGFVSGETIVCRARAPILKNPLLVDIRGMRVALTLAEAQMIKVKEF